LSLVATITVIVAVDNVFVSSPLLPLLLPLPLPPLPAVIITVAVTVAITATTISAFS